MNWFTDQRQRWIAETVGIFGFINREHIVRKFGVSVPQASTDLRDFQRMHPKAIEYDKTAKCYVDHSRASRENTHTVQRMRMEKSRVA
jgi:hypothetical protein